MTKQMSQHSDVCTSKPPCKTRQEMTKAHGTPREFAQAVWNCDELTYEECMEATEKYEDEWVRAPRD